MRPDQPIGNKEVCTMLNVSRQTLRYYRGHLPNRRYNGPAFPEPWELAQGPVWTVEQIRAWEQERADYEHAVMVRRGFVRSS